MQVRRSVLWLLAQSLLTVRADKGRNHFGIGAYYPPGIGQIHDAAELVGQGGTVLILVPVGNVTAETTLPPTCPGYDPAAQMKLAWSLGLRVVVRLEPQYSAFGCTGAGPSMPCAAPQFQCFAGTGNWVLPDKSLHWKGHLRALQDPGTNYTSYTRVAASYAQATASLPRPPDGSPLRVQIGNELNLAWDCDCVSDNVCMSMEQVAAEAAYFSRDALAALKAVVPALRVAITPIAPIGLEARPCCQSQQECEKVAANKSQCACPGGGNISFTSLSFEELMLRVR